MERFILLPTIALCGCEFFGIYEGGGETGGDPAEYWCTADGKCLLAAPSDPRVEAAIDQGWFVPHSLGTCESPASEWDTLVRVNPLANAGPPPPLRAAICPEMIDGYDGAEPNWSSFSICLPEVDAWYFEGAVGAVATLSGRWQPRCHELAPFGFAYPYLFDIPCYAGVSCLGFDAECACKCEDSSDCWEPQHELSEDYFGGESVLIDSGWELACTGYPWIWDSQAYGSGAWVGSTCEWNQPAPEPGEVPLPLSEVIGTIECILDDCAVPEGFGETLLASPGLWLSGSNYTLSSVITVNQPNPLLETFGIHSGDSIVAVGLKRLPATSGDAWHTALAELGNGHTALFIRSLGRGTHTITLTEVAP